MEQRADKSSELDPLPHAFNFDDRFHMMGEAGEGLANIISIHDIHDHLYLAVLYSLASQSLTPAGKGLVHFP